MLPTRFQPGTKLGRYELVRLLGGGAGGWVYEANDAVLERQVAVKVLNVPAVGGGAPERAAERFLREARIACRIRHPHVVDVFDFGLHEGVPFLVMELVDGETLGQLLAREGALPLGRALEILLPVLSAVAELHASHVVHRDIKPANVLLPRGDCARAQLADFGVSRFTEGASPITRPGALVGTLDYLAPEITRDGQVAGECSDQYALGVLLYECATGQKPFAGATDYALMHATVSGELLAPTLREPSLPSAFDDVVLRAMHRDPKRRFPCVDQLAEALLPMASDVSRARWSAEFVAPSDRSVSRARPSSPPSAMTPAAPERTLRDPPSETPISTVTPSVTRLRPSVVPASRSSRPPPLASADARPSVLVIDDDELNLRTFRRAFRSDFVITCADSGARALECLATACFDVALVDFAMPGMNGVEFLRAARSLNADLQAVMVTAHADLPEVRAALTGGLVQAIIMKPFDREGILRWVCHCRRMGSMRKSVGAMLANVDESGRR